MIGIVVGFVVFFVIVSGLAYWYVSILMEQEGQEAPKDFDENWNVVLYKKESEGKDADTE